MEVEQLLGFISLLLGIAGTYAKTQSDITRLKTEVRALQRKEDETTRLLEQLNQGIHRLEKALVKAGLIEIE